MSCHKIIRIPRLCGNCIFRKETAAPVAAPESWFCSKIQQVVHEQMLGCKKFHEYHNATKNKVTHALGWVIVLFVENTAPKLFASSARECAVPDAAHAILKYYEVRLNQHRPRPHKKNQKGKSRGRFRNLGF